jgi:hypothetical protein
MKIANVTASKVRLKVFDVVIPEKPERRRKIV